MHKLPDEMLRHIKREHQSAPHSEKRALLVRYAKLHKMSVATLYRKLVDLDRGIVKRRRADYGKPRITDLETLRRDMFAIAALRLPGSPRNLGEFGSTERALEIAQLPNVELISRTYSVGTANRWISRFGINQRGFKIEKKSVELLANHANHVLIVDATVSKIYYLRSDGTIVNDPSIFIDRSHGEDRLRKNNLKKIWLYCGVDLYSKAWWPLGFAGYRLGENSNDLFDFFREMFLQKENSPVHGLPDIIYSDPGSAMTSGIIERMATNLDIKLIQHQAFNPRAKGPVEARIHALQRQAEFWLGKLPREERPSTIDEYNEYMQAFARAHNAKTGAWLRFSASVKSRPLQTVTDDELLISIVEPLQRNIDKWGCISVDGQRFEVEDSHELMGKKKLDVYRKRNGDMVVLYDRKEYKVKKTGKVGVVVGEEFRAFPKSEGEINRDLVRLEAKKITGSITREDITSTQKNILHFTPNGEPVNVVGPLPHDEYRDAESAWLFIAARTGYSRGEFSEKLRDAIDGMFNALLALEPNVISADDIVKVCNSIQIQKKQEVENHG
ncbi:MAG: hypothetical protein J0L53_18485 [Spirochaetes bacterium]|nr:hypothetical protein [Spirochaetota bacterium]